MSYGTCLSASDWRRAAFLLDHMARRGLEVLSRAQSEHPAAQASLVCFNTQLLKLSWHSALSTLGLMLALNLEANLVTLNSILASCSWARCLQLFQLLKHQGLEADAVSETQMLAACGEQWQMATRLSSRAVLGPWQRSLTRALEQAILPQVTAWACGLQLLNLVCSGA